MTLALLIQLLPMLEQVASVFVPLVRGIVSEQRDPTPEEAEAIAQHVAELHKTEAIDADWQERYQRIMQGVK